MPTPTDAYLLVGPRDWPTDGVEDYCARLGATLGELGCQAHLYRVPWAEVGWPRALRALRERETDWRGRWALIQYTPFMWSARGVPLGLLYMIGALRRRGARVGLVFHDPVPHRGARLRHHIRQGGQLVAMRLAARSSDVVVSTIEPDRVPWMQDPVVRAKATLIPVGSCVPPAPAASQARSRDANGSRSVVVFGVTVAPNIPSEVTAREVADIRTALDGATRPSGRVELAVLGRGSADAEHLFRESFADTGVQMSIHGLLPEAEIAAILARADALLCVRGLISTRRTTAVAGVACGTPVVGFCGPETADPITEAGVRLVPYGDRAALASALGSVLSDDVLWHELQCRSRAAYEMYFSWPAIAQRYLEALSDG